MGIIALLVSPLSASTAQQRPDTTPTINAVGRMTMRAAPDRATIVLVVQTTAATAAEAGEAVTRIERAVMDTLVGFGIPRARLAATAYGVEPLRSAPNPQPVPIGANFTARTAITVDVTQLDRLTALTSAALAKGATLVGLPRFAVAAEDSLRRVAYLGAFAEARQAAEIAATAAGGRLGRLRHLSPDQQDLYGHQIEYLPMDSPYSHQQRPAPEVKITIIARGTWELIMR
jgi:uncharacterized protein YggE